MQANTLPQQPATQSERQFRYVLPFALFLAMLALFERVPLPARISAPLWFVVFTPVCLVCWPRQFPLKPLNPIGSILIGAGVFALWIAPEVLVPGYRNLPLFSNGLLGHVHSSLPPEALRSPWVLAWRTARAFLVVPIVEELFWRGWLMRWLINPNTSRVRLGTYAPLAFWMTAVLFASEHGPYWDVGLITGVIYNWWMLRTRSLADCVLMHAVTNLFLSLYVIYSGNWQYWQ